jgi:hypothetical protein
MSIAWTYRPPSAHFLAEFGHIYGPGRSRQVVPNVGNQLAFAIDEFMIEGPTVFLFVG